MTLRCGIDEAGRGPVIGPLVLGCVVLDDEGGGKLKKLNVKDSKKVSPKRRAELEKDIKEIAVEWKLCSINPSDIDYHRKRISLNMIEAMKIAEMITSLESCPQTVTVDSADTVPQAFKDRIIGCITRSNPEFRIPEIISEHKADDRYIEVSAASIIAKVERDREVERLKTEHGEFGSGYPSDELTQKFLRESVRGGEIPHFVRRSWNTLDKARQKKLSEFENGE